MIEEYLPGQDVSVIAFVNNGSVEILAMLDEINQQHSDGSVSGKAMAVPSRFADQPEADSIFDLTARIAQGFEIKHSPLLLSFRTTKNGVPALVEIHLDMGGDLILDVLLPAAGNFDALGYMIQALVNEAPLLDKAVWNPTAVVFGDGEGLISRRPYKLLKADTRAQLQKSLGY